MNKILNNNNGHRQIMHINVKNETAKLQFLLFFFSLYFCKKNWFGVLVANECDFCKCEWQKGQENQKVNYSFAWLVVYVVLLMSLCIKYERIK